MTSFVTNELINQLPYYCCVIMTRHLVVLGCAFLGFASAWMQAPRFRPTLRQRFTLSSRSRSRRYGCSNRFLRTSSFHPQHLARRHFRIRPTLTSTTFRASFDNPLGQSHMQTDLVAPGTLLRINFIVSSNCSYLAALR
jgi:hypothetical protein